MMKLTNSAIAEIKAVLHKPLENGEMRQIEAMGNLFVSFHKMLEDDDGTVIQGNAGMEFWFQYSLKIDGITYYFYGGVLVV